MLLSFKGWRAVEGYFILKDQQQEVPVRAHRATSGCSWWPRGAVCQHLLRFRFNRTPVRRPRAGANRPLIQPVLHRFGGVDPDLSCLKTDGRRCRQTAVNGVYTTTGKKPTFAYAPPSFGANIGIIFNGLVILIYPDLALIVSDPINSSVTQFPWLLL